MGCGGTLPPALGSGSFCFVLTPENCPSSSSGYPGSHGTLLPTAAWLTCFPGDSPTCFPPSPPPVPFAPSPELLAPVQPPGGTQQSNSSGATLPPATPATSSGTTPPPPPSVNSPQLPAQPSILPPVNPLTIAPQSLVAGQKVTFFISGGGLTPGASDEITSLHLCSQCACVYSACVRMLRRWFSA